MTARPEGTDGSDHFFRQIIAKRYQRIAKARKHTPFLLVATFIMVMVKATFHTFTLLEGQAPAKYAISIALNAAIMLGLYFFGNIGGPRERLNRLKFYSFSCAMIVVQHVLSAYPYYMLWEEGDRVSSSLVSYAMRTGDYDVEWMRKVAGNAEQFIDMMLLILATFNALNIHGMTMDKMEQAKEKKNDAKEAKKEAKKTK